jgi:hypothetical protein
MVALVVRLARSARVRAGMADGGREPRVWTIAVSGSDCR